MAVDRKVFADTVFLGAGVPVYGPETPANKTWYWTGIPHTPHDPAGARRLLASIGLTLWVTWQLEGGAAAVNEAGRMRMQAYRLSLSIGTSDLKALREQTTEKRRKIALDYDRVVKERILAEEAAAKK